MKKKTSIFRFAIVSISVMAIVFGWLFFSDTPHGHQGQSKSNNQYVLPEKATSFDIYEHLREKIIGHSVLMKDIDTFSSVINNGSDFEKIKKTVLLISKSSDRDRPYLYSKLYEQFIKAKPNMEVLYTFLNTELTRRVENAGKHTDTRGNKYAWGWAYGAHAAVLAYKANGEERFLDILVNTYSQILDMRDSELGIMDDVHGRVMKSWGSGIHKEGMWVAHVTTVGRITYPVALFCKIVMNDEHLQERYGLKAKEFLESIETAVTEFDEDFIYDPELIEGYYIRRAYDEIEPLNHMHALGNTLVILYSITNKEEYRKKAEAIANFFLSCVDQNSGGAYEWGYRPSPEKRKGHDAEPYWKGQITSFFPLVAYEHQIVFRKEHMKAIAATFLQNISRGNNEFNRYLSYTKFRPVLSTLETKGGKDSGLVGWIFYDVIDPEVRSIIEDAVAIRLDLFPDGWFQSTLTAQAYSYRAFSCEGAEFMLRNKKKDGVIEMQLQTIGAKSN